jgi:hypothetical protein
MNILYNCICSDHRPVSFKLDCQESDYFAVCDEYGFCYCKPVLLYDWSKVDNNIAGLYIHCYCNMQCMNRSIDRVIPVTIAHDSQFNIPGWSSYVKEKYMMYRQKHSWPAWV